MVLINRLQAVRTTGEGKYLARCPAHEDRSPSLSIRQLDDGRVLLHCFAGCETQSVLAAVGLTFADIMPEPVGHKLKPRANRIQAAEALKIIEHETRLVGIVAADILEKREVE